MRAGAPLGGPDAVVYPATHEQVLAVLAVCSQERVAVVPFGGGTSIVGGLAPTAGAQHAVISLDLARLGGVFAVDPRSLTVSVAAGTRGPALEAALAEHDLTLGHYPDSFEFVSIGGCAATRSVARPRPLRAYRPGDPGRADRDAGGGAGGRGAAGQRSRTGNARADRGFEGVLGVITGLLLRVRTRPARQSYEGVVFDTFAAACEALRAVIQDRAMPDVVRVSDELQTEILMAAGESGGRRAPLGRRGLRGRDGALLIVGWEGQRDSVDRRRLHTMTLLRRGGGNAIGAQAGSAWRPRALLRLTCVTSCSAAACWWTSSRRRALGAGSSHCARA